MLFMLPSGTSPGTYPQPSVRFGPLLLCFCVLCVVVLTLLEEALVVENGHGVGKENAREHEAGQREAHLRVRSVRRDKSAA